MSTCILSDLLVKIQFYPALYNSGDFVYGFLIFKVCVSFFINDPKYICIVLIAVAGISWIGYNKQDRFFKVI